jgi:hypothetical protein
VLLVVARGLAALFATASQKPSTRTTVTETSRLVLITSDEDGCTIPQREFLAGGPVEVPISFYCRTHRQAARFQKHLVAKYAGLVAVSLRGRRVVLFVS